MAMIPGGHGDRIIATVCRYATCVAGTAYQFQKLNDGFRKF
jgi:hypothetical protein